MTCNQISQSIAHRVNIMVISDNVCKSKVCHFCATSVTKCYRCVQNLILSTLHTAFHQEVTSQLLMKYAYNTDTTYRVCQVKPPLFM